MDKIEEIFDDIVKQASKGEIKIGECVYNIKFYVSYNCENKKDDFVLKISDKKQFLKLLTDYVDLVIKKNNITDYNEEQIKKTISLLFSNITYQDFDNGILFIQKHINFLQNSLQNKTIENIEHLNYSDIIIENKTQSLMLETPYCFETTICQNDDKYKLPKISYGISNGKCYIYSVQNDTNFENNEYTKKIKRLLYKLNNNIEENKEYLEFKQGISTYYPENISDVSPSFILALSIFIKELDLQQINDIEVVTFLPIRYYAKEKAYYKKLKYKSNINNLDNKQRLELYKKSIEEHTKIQYNLTNKMIRNFYRLKYHFSGLEIVNDIDNAYEYLKIKINNIKCDNNVLLSEIINKRNNVKNK